MRERISAAQLLMLVLLLMMMRCWMSASVSAIPSSSDSGSSRDEYRTSSGDAGSVPLYPWKQKESYYFDSLDRKISLLAADPKQVATIVRLADHQIVPPTNDSVMHISSFPVTSSLVDWWRSFQKPRQMRVEPYLCQAVYEKKRPIFHNQGCQLPHYMNPSAPRCQTKYLKWICDSSQMEINETASNGFVLPESDHLTTFFPPTPWLLTATNALVSMCGTILSKAGAVHTTANCMATGNRYNAKLFSQHCSLPSLPESISHLSLCNAQTPYSQEVTYHEKVFVVAEVDDSYVYHLHLEIFPRIAYHLDFLLRNPDIKILIGCDMKQTQELTESGLRHMLLSIKPMMDLAGLSMDRLVVHKHVFARQVHLPMEGACQDPVYNTWQILTMRRLFMSKLGIDHNLETDARRRRPRVMMLMKRSVGAKHTRNNQDSVRQWSDEFTDRLIASLSKQFPSYHVVLFSDKNTSMMSCYSCQIRAFSEADVLIGVHGAGLANMLYMKPNSAVVEFAPYGNDGRCLLGGGPFSRIAAVMSHNYMMHHPRYDEYRWLPTKTCEFNISRFTQHVFSFLRSIDFA